MKATKKVGEVDNEVEDYIQDDRYGDVSKNNKQLFLWISQRAANIARKILIFYID